MNDTKNAYIAVVGIKNSTLHSADAILCKVLCVMSASQGSVKLFFGRSNFEVFGRCRVGNDGFVVILVISREFW